MKDVAIVVGSRDLAPVRWAGLAEVKAEADRAVRRKCGAVAREGEEILRNVANQGETHKR